MCNIHSFSGIIHYNPEILLLDTIETGNYYSNSINLILYNANDERSGIMITFISDGNNPIHESDVIATATPPPILG